jgi:lysozyme family protein
MDNAKFKTALQFTLRWEGGYVNHPADPGGATNKGITQAVYDRWRERQGKTKRSVLFITDDEVEQIYIQDYWIPSKAAIMVLPLAVVHFDTAVNFGVRGAIMFLQEAINAPPIDGIWGPITEKQFQKNNTKDTAFRIIEGRISYRYQRVRQNPSQRVFLQGWLNRDNDLKAFIKNL